MRRNILTVATLALFIASVMGSCSEQSKYPGYEQTQSGLYYKFYTQNEGETPQVGELLEMVFSCVVNDTTVIIPATPNIFQLQEPLFKGDIFEGMAMMHKGDSASFIVDIDSTFVTFFGQPTLPSEFNPTDVMRFEMKLNDVYTEQEYAMRYAEDVRKMNAERTERMKEVYPEETAKAAKELADFMKKNKIEAEPTETGLLYVMTSEGNGEKPEVGKPVKVHYTGKLLNGKVFDSSVERGEPIMFDLGVGRVIPGWDEGIQLMSKGEKGVLYIPYYLAYGERDMGIIPPFSNLMFEVELVDF